MHLPVRAADGRIFSAARLAVAGSSLGFIFAQSIRTAYASLTFYALLRRAGKGEGSRFDIYNSCIALVIGRQSRIPRAAARRSISASR